eukprot:scaffold467897_cov18-Prasinocladus_malaysianus.AAC.2
MTRRSSQRPRPRPTAANVYVLLLFAASGMPNATMVAGLTPAEGRTPFNHQAMLRTTKVHRLCLACGLHALS